MLKNIEICQDDSPSKEDAAYVSKQFVAFNDRQSGVFPSKEIHIFARTPDRQVIAGLIGDISWGWMHIDTIWVDKAYRKNGIGTALMDLAEAEASAMGVDQAYLETTDFQAYGFYEKRGYQVFAQLENQPPGHVCYYMKKLNLGGKTS